MMRLLDFQDKRYTSKNSLEHALSIIAGLIIKMWTDSSVCIRAATASDDAMLATHFYQMWLDNQVSVDAIAPNWLETTLQFIEQARLTLNYQAFIAEVEQQIVGSAGCQRFAGLYPNIMNATDRCDGYIWGVYVEPAYRSQGIATQLMHHAIAHLKAIGCSHAVLNASPSGRPVYARLGFADSNLMRLDLRSEQVTDGNC